MHPVVKVISPVSITEDFSIAQKENLEMSSWSNVYSAGLQNRSKRVPTPFALIRSLSDKYPWERLEPPYTPSYGLKSITAVLLEGWLRHLITMLLKKES